MPEIMFKNGELFCEGLKVSGLAKKFKTPLYIYSYTKLINNFREVKNAFREVEPLVCFAMKSNDNLSIIRALVKEGAGFDIVSGGELKKAVLANANMKKIVFASVGKTEEEILLALKAGILFFNAESEGELLAINRSAKKLNLRPSVALRINPDVAAVTHDKISTGTLRKKFGIDLKSAQRILRNQNKYPNLNFNGLHMHIGSQITSVEPYEKALRKAAAFIEALKNDGIGLEYFNMGGGIGISYTGEKVPSPSDYAKKLVPILKKTGLKVIIEPGRFISSTAGIFITKVLYLKDNGVKKFLIVDAGMNDMMRPSLYDAYHKITPLKPSKGKNTKMDVVGPICESGDFFAKDRALPPTKVNDFIAIHDTGAYGYVMSSNYNVRPRGMEVMVKGNKAFIIKERETFKDLIRGENIPGFLK
ncbi:MAG: diaminopimelate decarboxylase [Candidatus Omnitrophica bacterium]|nr:diaminopimelate decarboxylase [Candidatus Omnitrophota bacterium]